MTSVAREQLAPGTTIATSGGARALTPLRSRGELAAFGFAAATVAALGVANGGYFPSSWGWAALLFSGGVVWIVSVSGLRRPTTSAVLVTGSLLLLAVWSAISSLWAGSAFPVTESFRMLVYVSGVAVALAGLSCARARPLAGGILTGVTIVCGYGLLTRLFPDRIGTFDSVATYRLASPVGYWNSLGLLCAIGLLLSLSMAGSTALVRRSAFAALPAPALGTTLYFTFSRGSWIALGVGLAIALALDPRRLRLTATIVAVGLPTVLAVVLASGSNALTHTQTSIELAARDGHKLALALALLTIGSSGLSAAVTAACRSVQISRRVSGAYAGTLLLAGACAVALLLVRTGGPVAGARSGWDSFTAEPPRVQTDLRKRLFSFSGNHRVQLFNVAWSDARRNPLLGTGAGSYERTWLRHRPFAGKVRDAHSLYLETLAELGVVGVALLAVALGTPVVIAVRARRRPGVAGAAGAYVAYLAAAAVDWHWEVPAVTLAALLTGVFILVSARREEGGDAPRGLRSGILAVAVAVAAMSFVFLVGNMFLSRSEADAHAGRWGASAGDARKSTHWIPWSTQPWTQLGEAQLARGQMRSAVRSFQKALSKDPTDWTLWFDLARASAADSNRQKAALARAYELNPLSPELVEFRRELSGQGGISIAAGGG